MPLTSAEEHSEGVEDFTEVAEAEVLPITETLTRKRRREKSTMIQAQEASLVEEVVAENIVATDLAMSAEAVPESTRNHLSAETLRRETTRSITTKNRRLSMTALHVVEEAEVVHSEDEVSVEVAEANSEAVEASGVLPIAEAEANIAEDSVEVAAEEAIDPTGNIAEEAERIDLEAEDADSVEAEAVDVEALAASTSSKTVTVVHNNLFPATFLATNII